jgi:hypothetical protein
MLYAPAQLYPIHIRVVVSINHASSSDGLSIPHPSEKVPSHFLNVNLPLHSS